MHVYRIPDTLRGIIFDIDGTLYDSPGYLRSMRELLVRRLAEHRAIGERAAGVLVDQTGRRWAREHQGRRPPLGEVFLLLGVSMQQSVSWRENLFEPERYLHHDPLLDQALAGLAGEHVLCALTNNPRAIGRRTLEALGVSDRFPCLVGLDDTLRSKPAVEPFKEALARMGCRAAEVLSVGDRYEVDVETALEMGMGGIVVESVEEIYRLPALLSPGKGAPAEPGYPRRRR